MTVYPRETRALIKSIHMLKDLKELHLLDEPDVPFAFNSHEFNFPSTLTVLDICLELRSEFEYNALIRYLHSAPPLEYLLLNDLQQCPDAFLMALADYMANSDTLLEVMLCLDKFRNPDVLQTFLARLSSSTIARFEIRTDEPTYIPKEAIVPFLNSIKFMRNVDILTIECEEKLSDSQWNEVNQLVKAHPSVHSFSIAECEFYKSSPIDEERAFVAEYQCLVTLTRLVSGCRPKKKFRVPMEIIMMIVKTLVHEKSLIAPWQLSLVLRCLFDRRTLGRVTSQSQIEWYHFNPTILYIQCFRALKRLA